MKKILFVLAIAFSASYSYSQCCNVVDQDGVAVEDQFGVCVSHGDGASADCAAKDSDGDGIADSKDACPSVKGIAANNGCPEVQEEVKTAIKAVFEGLEFETDSDVIKTTCYDKLDNLAAVMNKFKTLKIKISGHTDKTGDAKYNMSLSERRAQAAKTYLIDKGIAASRLAAYGYGEEKPIASNDTPEGRKQNRRVDFNVVFGSFKK